MSDPKNEILCTGSIPLNFCHFGLPTVPEKVFNFENLKSRFRSAKTESIDWPKQGLEL